MTFAHWLPGCAPAPLAYYLKALGIVRLIGGQTDSEIRAFWRDDNFIVLTKLSRDELLAFFLDEYAPTPMLTPWNGGSGFYPKDRKVGIDAIANSTVQRFTAYRDAIAVARMLVGDRNESPKDDEKVALLKACKAAWSGAALEWANASTVVTQASKIAYPAILGSGGNDGRLDFANNFMQRLAELLPTTAGESARPESRDLVAEALFQTPTRDLSNVAVGQFLPGGAGGVNASAGFSGEGRINLWDYILMLEGAMLLQVSTVRRLDGSLSQASAPFAVRSRAVGYASAARSDESARGEQWFPLWTAPATLRELKALFVEGRLQSGRRRAGEAIEAAQALCRFGTARGVASFQRYAYAERNGQANLAVPIGRFRVRANPHIGLIDDIEDWVARLRRAGANQHVAFDRHARRLEALMLELCSQTDARPSFVVERLLEALGAAEAELVRRPRATASENLRPLPTLSPQWHQAIGRGTPEFELALAIALQRDVRENRGRGNLRRHFVPLEGVRFRVAQDTLVNDADVVWRDRDLVTDLGNVVLRRLISAERTERFPLVAGPATASIDAVQRFLAGSIDEARVGRMARALLALELDEKPMQTPDRALDLRLDIPAVYALFRVLYSPWPLEDAEVPRVDDRPVFPSLKSRSDLGPLRQLIAGRLDEAASNAALLLRISGGRPRLRRFVGNAALARRLVAAMAIPISRYDTFRLGALVFKPDLVGRAQERESDETALASVTESTSSEA